MSDCMQWAGRVACVVHFLLSAPRILESLADAVHFAGTRTDTFGNSVPLTEDGIKSVRCLSCNASKVTFVFGLDTTLI
jgi:hypothetical protein